MASKPQNRGAGGLHAGTMAGKAAMQAPAPRRGPAGTAAGRAVSKGSTPNKVGGSQRSSGKLVTKSNTGNKRNNQGMKPGTGG